MVHCVGLDAGVHSLRNSLDASLKIENFNLRAEIKFRK